MSAEKTVSVSYRVTPEFKALLELAAAQAHRSRTNLLEKLLFDHCRDIGLLPAAASAAHENIKQGLR
jgi:uncharacterized protein (DUF1778 family)